MIYKMLLPGSTTGAVTGDYKTWTKDQLLTAPEDEFKHLPASVYQVVGMGSTEDGENESPQTLEISEMHPEYERATDEPQYNATPAAVHAAEQTGVSLLDVTGTGSGGKITKTDVDDFVSSRAEV